MRVEYRIESLPDLQEIDLEGVALETANACPVCESAQLLQIAHLRGSLVSAHCCECGHLFHQTRPDATWYARWYATNWDGAAKRQSPAAPRTPPGAHLASLLRQRVGRAMRALVPTSDLLPGKELFDFCRPAITPKDRVLDIGCGYGGHLLPFIEYGCGAFGIEASPHRAQAAAKRGARTANVPVESLDVQTFSTRFQLVISNHVFEHVHDPNVFLRAVARVLEPSGWLSLTVPNQENDFLLQQFFFALHIHCFSANSLVETLRRNGFVTHRLLQDNQLRVLAQYQPEQARKQLIRRIAKPNVSELTESVARLTFGDEYNLLRERELYCRWTNHVRAIRHVYDVRYSAERPRVDERAIRISWSGEKTLPLSFVKATAPDRAVPFWVK